MFKGRGLYLLVGSLIFVSTLVIVLEWRALRSITAKKIGERNPGERSPGERNLEDDSGDAAFRQAHRQSNGVSNGADGASKPAHSGGPGFLQPKTAGSATSLAPMRLSFPTPPEVRHAHCVGKLFEPATLPKVSLVIPYLNETWMQMEATVASILSFTPMQVIDEILFVDDGNAPEWQHHQQLRDLHPKIRVHRNEERQGLIRAKVIGAGLIKSPVLMFMEPHCVVGRHWIEPLLEQLALSTKHDTVVMPMIDIIPEANFNEYQVANHHIGGFDWSLTFNWMALIEHRNKSYRYPDPYPTPALSGGIFGIWRDYWLRMGTYDTNMGESGGEHIEMSLRTWRCGGNIKVVPCSRMGHVFRARNPYVVHPALVIRNLKRAALVWLDDHIEKFYHQVPSARNLDAGNVTERLKLKESLHCKSMAWYIEEIYPELKGDQPKPRRR